MSENNFNDPVFSTSDEVDTEVYNTQGSVVFEEDFINPGLKFFANLLFLISITFFLIEFFRDTPLPVFTYIVSEVSFIGWLIMRYTHKPVVISVSENDGNATIKLTRGNRKTVLKSPFTTTQSIVRSSFFANSYYHLQIIGSNSKTLSLVEKFDTKTVLFDRPSHRVGYGDILFSFEPRTEPLGKLTKLRFAIGRFDR
ncbi:MAG TPA: hypothetical protein PLP35_07085 [Caldisericia bacterium]|nr:hypothetical protein [Caldisericia bacterium]HRV75587.1 hypothetical protein [Caldisericia bacterium]